MAFPRSFYEPFNSLAQLDRLLDDHFERRASDQATGERQVQHRGNPSVDQSILLRPRMDLHENAEGNSVTATFELPGVRKEDVSIDVRDRHLVVTGEMHHDAERDEHGYAIRERRFGRFSRTLQLPQGVKDGEIKAAMENGVLTVTFPRSAPEAAPKKITIA